MLAEADETPITSMPVYVVGDSHALPYRDLIFPDKFTGRWMTVRSKYVSGLTAGDVCDASSGAFHAELVRFLEYEGLVRDGIATHLSRSAIDFAIAKASQQPKAPPLILITVGDIDIRGAIMPMLRDTHDFVPPFDTGVPTLDLPLVPWAIIEEKISERMAPLGAGLRQLAACGFNRIYVQGVVPPTLDEQRSEDLNGYRCGVSVRTKLVLAFNRALAACCADAGAVFLDLWPVLTEGPYLKAELEMDGVHLPPRVARLYIEAMLEHAINCQWFSVNHVRYDLYYELCCGHSPFAPQSLQPTT